MALGRPAADIEALKMDLAEHLKAELDQLDVITSAEIHRMKESHMGTLADKSAIHNNYAVQVAHAQDTHLDKKESLDHDFR